MNNLFPQNTCKEVCEEAKPKIIMLVGLPGSGKSFYANQCNLHKMTILSSDMLRKELLNDENDQKHNEKVFNILHQRIRDCLLAGQSVIYDATNLNKDRRIKFLKTISNIDCIKEAVCIMTPYQVCLEQNKKRDRVVPESVIERMYKSWNPPHISEGFDCVKFVFNGYDERKYNLYDLFYGVNGIINFKQDSHFHSLTLGNHSLKAELLIRDRFPRNANLQFAALLHDIGKVQTKTFMSSDGKRKDEEAHYYYHNCVSAYESVFYLHNHTFQDCDISYIANMIYYHMRPYFAWKDKKKEERDRLRIGEKMYTDIIRLHYADVAAH